MLTRPRWLKDQLNVAEAAARKNRHTGNACEYLFATHVASFEKTGAGYGSTLGVRMGFVCVARQASKLPGLIGAPGHA